MRVKIIRLIDGSEIFVDITTKVSFPVYTSVEIAEATISESKCYNIVIDGAKIVMVYEKDK